MPAGILFEIAELRRCLSQTIFSGAETLSDDIDDSAEKTTGNEFIEERSGTTIPDEQISRRKATPDDSYGLHEDLSHWTRRILRNYTSGETGDRRRTTTDAVAYGPDLTKPTAVRRILRNYTSV